MGSPKATHGPATFNDCVSPGFNAGPGLKEVPEGRNGSQVFQLERSKKKMARILQDEPSRNSQDMTKQSHHSVSKNSHNSAISRHSKTASQRSRKSIRSTQKSRKGKQAVSHSASKSKSRSLKGSQKQLNTPSAGNHKQTQNRSLRSNNDSSSLMARKQQQQESGSQLSRGTRSKAPQHQRSMTCTATNSIGLSSSAEQMHFGQSQPIHSFHVTNPTNTSIQYLQQTHDQTATTLDGIFNGSQLNQNQ